jgi:hypothetical protein
VGRQALGEQIGGRLVMGRLDDGEDGPGGAHPCDGRAPVRPGTTM